jgi:hypothetical protein
MPLKSGSSKKVISENIAELHHGNTYAKTSKKFGSDKANKQAVAIAYSKARGRAMGGVVPGVGGMMMGGNQMPVQGAPMGLADAGAAFTASAGNTSPGSLSALQMASGGGVEGVKAPGPASWVTRAEAHNVARGAILSSVPGRTDAHKTHVASGSYVIPADIVSGRGQGNTIAGAQTLTRMFGMGPYGSSPGKISGRGRGIPAPPKPPKFARGGADTHEGKPVRVDLAGGEIVVPPEHLRKHVHHDLKTAHEIMDKWVLAERKKLRKTLAKLKPPVKD